MLFNTLVVNKIFPISTNFNVKAWNIKNKKLKMILFTRKVHLHVMINKIYFCEEKNCMHIPLNVDTIK